MSTNTKGIYYSTSADAPITEEARSLALANSVPVGPNYIINGAFDFWQRGTTLTNNTAHLADRWYVTANTSGNQCNQSRVSVPATTGSSYGLRVQQTSSVTVVEYAARQMIEAQNIFTLLGKTITVSFWYRSNKTGTHSVRFSAATRATGAVDVNTGFTVSSADTWAKYSITFTTFSSATAWVVGNTDWGALLDIGFRTGASVGFTSLAANDYFEVAGVQLEEGSYATPFHRNQPNIQAELAACQRYCTVFPASSVEIFNPYFSVALSSGGQRVYASFPVEMRATPNVYSPSGGTLHSFLYYPSNAGSNGTVSIYLFAANNRKLSGSFSNTNNGGNSLAAVYATGENNNNIFVNAEF